MLHFGIRYYYLAMICRVLVPVYTGVFVLGQVSKVTNIQKSPK